MTDLKDLKELAEAAISISPQTVLELIARVEAAERSLKFASGACEMSVETTVTLRTALEQAKAREAELRRALQPFAFLAEHDCGDYEDDNDRYIKGANCPVYLSVGDLRRARNAVTAMGGDDNG